MPNARAVLVAQATSHVADMLAISLQHTAAHAAVVVYDTQCELAAIMAQAYHAALPDAAHLSFDDAAPAELLAAFAALHAGDLVVLVQSTSFRIESFRIRVELYKRGIKVIEHANLARMAPDEVAIYIDALAYDAPYYRGVGGALKAKLDAGQRVVVQGGGATLTYDGGFEAAKLNTGDYSATNNIGSMFPIGEVFTEARDLEQVSGRVMIYAFADLEFYMHAASPPIALIIERGRVVGAENSTPAFDEVLRTIALGEGGEVWVRELGMGLNRSFSRERMVRDVGAFERVCGVHLSLGAKHGVYKKPGLRHKDAHYHVDVFPITERVVIDDAVVFTNGGWHA